MFIALRRTYKNDFCKLAEVLNLVVENAPPKSCREVVLVLNYAEYNSCKAIRFFQCRLFYITVVRIFFSDSTYITESRRFTKFTSKKEEVIFFLFDYSASKICIESF